MSKATIDDHAHWLDLCAGNEPSAQDAERLHNIAVLLRALSAGQAQPVAIKPLEWEDNHGVGFNATTVSGIYSIDIGAGEYRVFVPGKWPPVGYTLLEAAKAAAQSDYEARIRSALVSPAVPGEVHAQLALIKHLAEYTTEKNWDDKRLYIMQAVDRALSAPLPEIEGGDKGDGWQPIETAPKDGKTILIAARGVVRTAWWGAAAFNRKTKGYDRGWTDGPNHGFEPTHWMPFPAAPSASIEGAE